MIFDANGGGLTPSVVAKLTDRLGDRYLVTNMVDADGEILAVTVTTPDGRRGNIRISPHLNPSVEWWTPYDPNGAPTSWTSYDPAHSDGVDEAVMIIVDDRHGAH